MYGQHFRGEGRWHAPTPSTDHKRVLHIHGCGQVDLRHSFATAPCEGTSVGPLWKGTNH